MGDVRVILVVVGVALALASIGVGVGMELGAGWGLAAGGLLSGAVLVFLVDLGDDDTGGGES